MVKSAQVSEVTLFITGSPDVWRFVNIETGEVFCFLGDRFTRIGDYIEADTGTLKQNILGNAHAKRR